MEFGARLKELRRAGGLSQSGLAQALGVTVRTVQNYEAGKVLPKRGEIYDLASELFGIEPQALRRFRKG